MYRNFFFPLSIFALLCCQGPAFADDFSVTPFAHARHEYNDNIFMNSANTVEDNITTLVAGLDIINKTERLNFSLNGHLDRLLYADNNELNNTEQFYQGQLGYSFNEFFSLRGSAHYSVEYRPDRDLETSGYINSAKERRKEMYSLSADATHTEKLSSFYSYSYEHTVDTDPTASDYSSHFAILGIDRALAFSRPTSLRLYGSGSLFKFSTSDTESYQLTVGIKHQFTEKTSLLVDIGPRHNIAENKINQDTERNTDWGGNLELKWQAERTTAGLSLSRQVQGSTNYDGPTQRNSLTLFSRYHLTEKSWLRLDLSQRQNKGDSKYSFTSDLDELASTITPSLRYGLTDHLFCRLLYKYSFVRDRENNIESTRNLVWLQLKYSLPIIE